jgi:signal transduction histidine kinase
MTDLAPPPRAINALSDARMARRAAVGALAAELGHDLQGPLNLFRSITERLERGHALDSEDVALLREELERLGRFTGRLRELSRYVLDRAPHSPAQLVARALSLAPVLEPASWGSSLALGEGSDAPSVLCDGALVALAIRELLDNALEARHGRSGVRFEQGAPACLCVWDDGAGFDRDPGLSARSGVTTRPGAAGLGLTVALRVARAHGFGLHFSRSGGLTEVRLSFDVRGV